MTRDIIVVGGSAGGVEAVLRLAKGLPPDLPAAVFVVIHSSPHGKGGLSGLINRAGPLSCVLAGDGDGIEAGMIYLARPDHHLLLEAGKVRVVRGPLENRHRPAIDPLFRSAAVTYGARVIGVILSGILDDGAAGLAVVKKSGGRTVVQHPEDALFPSMPRNAMDAVKVDHVLPLDEMPALFSRLCREPAEEIPEPSDSDKAEAGIAAGNLVSEAKMLEAASPSVFICPDCGGDLFEYADSQPLRFRCSIGHAVNGISLLEAQSGKVQEALATSFRVLLENQRLYKRMLEDFTRRNLPISAAGIRRKAEALESPIQVIRGLLATLGQGGSEAE